MAPFTQPEQRRPEDDNLVSSFEVGIMTVKGSWVGICIKFSMHDRTAKITHWAPSAYRSLIEALQEYYQYLGPNAFMFRAAADPSLVADLPERHPYHTLITEAPSLNEEETGTAGFASGIDRATFAIRGPTFEMRPTFGNGRTESIYMHEYTALSMLGYLQQYTQAAKALSGPAAGNA